MSPDRILYIDCDSLRPDHLGCYGYHRDTSPNIDQIAADGLRFTNYYTSDSPCLPSRTALFTGRFGIHTGVLNHGGINADLRSRGRNREFGNRNPTEREFKTWMMALREQDYRTATISPFPTRHAAWHVLDGFQEWMDPSETEIAADVAPGHERAEMINPPAEQWLERHADDAGWFLHVNYWDPHTAYDTPEAFGYPFADEPAPDWPTEEVIQEHTEGYGPNSALDVGMDLPRTPSEIASRGDFEQWIDAYDVSIRYMDEYIGQLFDVLEDQGVLDETLIIVSADHGENQGELNIYADHSTADDLTCRVPLVMRGPSVKPGVDDGLHYQIDLPPTITDLVGGDPSPRWDGRSFATTVQNGEETGREFLVLSHGAWTCTRGVRWGPWLLLRTYHPGLEDLEPIMLWNLEEDPHETENLAEYRPDVVDEGLSKLHRWHDTMLLHAARGQRGGTPDAPNGITDPLWEIIRDGDPYHVQGRLESYAQRLRETGRGEHADVLERERQSDEREFRQVNWNLTF
jgi:arylsulfatase A-like enzyme